MLNLYFIRSVFKAKASGSSLMLAFALITMLMLELAMMSTILTRSLGEEGATMSQNGVARSYLEHAIMSSEYNTYGGSNQYGPSATLDSCWGPSGSTLWCMFSNYAWGDGTISGWLQTRRGSFYKLRAEARVGPVYLQANRWQFYNPCSATGRATTLSSSAGYTPVYNTRTGRFFFGTSGGQYLTWHVGTGLSTLATGISNAGDSNAGAVYEGNERVFFGQSTSPGSFYTWAESTGLSTLLSGTNAAGAASSTVVDPTTGRVYFGDLTGAGVGNFYSWYNGSLTTIVNGRGNPGRGSGPVVDPLTGRVFFGENSSLSNPNFYTWSSSTGLSTLLVNRARVGASSVYMDPLTGRAFMGDRSSPSNFYTWSSSTGLSTLIVGAANHTDPGLSSGAISASTGRLFFGERFNTTGSNFWTWLPSTGLSTILSGAFQYTGSTNLYANNTAVVSTYGSADRVFFAAHVDATNTNYLTWKASTGLSTILSGRPYLGANGVADSTTGRVFFGDQDPASSYVGNYYTWDSSTGLSTLVSGTSYLGQTYGAAAVQLYSSRLMLSEYNNPGNVYTWHPMTGLTVLVSSANTPTNIFIDPGSGYVYFVAGSTYIYQPADMCMQFGY